MSAPLRWPLPLAGLTIADCEGQYNPIHVTQSLFSRQRGV